MSRRSKKQNLNNLAKQIALSIANSPSFKQFCLFHQGWEVWTVRHKHTLFVFLTFVVLTVWKLFKFSSCITVNVALIRKKNVRMNYRLMTSTWKIFNDHCRLTKAEISNEYLWYLYAFILILISWNLYSYSYLTTSTMLLISILHNSTYIRNIKKNKAKATLTHMYIELFISKPTITAVWVWERWITEMQHKQISTENTLLNISNT